MDDEWIDFEPSAQGENKAIGKYKRIGNTVTFKMIVDLTGVLSPLPPEQPEDAA
jgi:hypothetical protein